MIKRDIKNKILNWAKKEKILILKGSRQVGKTTILRQIKLELEQKHPNAIVVYLLADDIDNKPIFTSNGSLELHLKQFYGFPEKYIFLLIDEFQAIGQAGIFLKNIFDQHKDKLQLIVSGSSSLEITKNSEFLTGRAIHFNIERINFKEFFDFTYKTKTKKIPAKDFKDVKLFHQTFSNKLSLALKEYITFGGYPEAITTKKLEDKKVILKSIIQTYIEKDIINFLNVENITGFNNLIKILSSRIGNLVNINEISNTINLSTNTLKKYLDILIGTYIFNLMSPYYKNIRSEISKMPKNYILDLGIRNYLLKSFVFDEGANNGDMIENFVYLSLLANFPKDCIHFYRTISGAEIDFVIEKDDGKIILCEVKYSSKAKITGAIKNFEKKYPQVVSEKIIITKDTLKKEGGVFYIPAALLPFVEL